MSKRAPLLDHLHDLLRRHDTLVPLGRVADEVREARGSYDAAPARLRACLAAEPARFIVVDAAPPLPGVERWPASVRERYAPALRRSGDEPIVAVVGAGLGRAAERVQAQPPSLEALEGPLLRTLAQLGDADAAAELEQAARAVWAVLAALSDAGGG